MYAQSLGCVWLFVTPWTVCSPPGFAVHVICRQEYWGGLAFPTPGILLIQRLNPYLLHHRQLLYHWATREAHIYLLRLYLWKSYPFSLAQLKCYLLHETLPGISKQIWASPPQSTWNMSEGSLYDKSYFVPLKFCAPAFLL